MLWYTILPRRSSGSGVDSVHSNVTCSEIIETFKTILLDEFLINQAKRAATVGKRSHPGDLKAASNGWDVIDPPKRTLSRKSKVNPITLRRAKLMTKGTDS